jgi:phosphoenolpyruvate-protein kinase (PTS system EI component)
MAAPLIPEVKEVLRAVSLEQAQDLARQALDQEDAAAVAALVTPLLGAS